MNIMFTEIRSSPGFGTLLKVHFAVDSQRDARSEFSARCVHLRLLTCSSIATLICSYQDFWPMFSEHSSAIQSSICFPPCSRRAEVRTELKGGLYSVKFEDVCF